jgi:hypothetical protein
MCRAGRRAVAAGGRAGGALKAMILAVSTLSPLIFSK